MNDGRSCEDDVKTLTGNFVEVLSLWTILKTADAAAQ